MKIERSLTSTDGRVVKSSKINRNHKFFYKKFIKKARRFARAGPGFSCTGQPARAGLFCGPGQPSPGFQKRPGPARAARVPTLIFTPIFP
jgi:hypothetical protein